MAQMQKVKDPPPKAKPRTKVVSYFDKRLHERLRRFAFNEKVSISEAVQMAVREMLDG